MTQPLPNILLVDDQPNNLLALEDLLEDMEASLLMAGSGNEALALASLAPAKRHRSVFDGLPELGAAVSLEQKVALGTIWLQEFAERQGIRFQAMDGSCHRHPPRSRTSFQRRAPDSRYRAGRL